MAPERSKSIKGSVVQVVGQDDTGRWLTDPKALNDIFNAAKCRDLPACIISIAGDYRKGKSFMLNFFLRYLHALEAGQDTENGTGWMGPDNEPINLHGFDWRGGTTLVTRGVCLWSRPFIVSTSNYKNMAVFLMDTQGSFDSTYRLQDSALVFAIGTLISSVEIYNLMRNIQENDLQILQLFTEYGRMVLSDGTPQNEREQEPVNPDHPFQRLIFLIRDWGFPYEFPYGADGGSRFLERFLTIKTEQPDEIKAVRQHIKRCFEDIACYLMPFPGNTVARDPHFNGTLSQIDPDFIEQLGQFVPFVLSPERLIPKKIGGSIVPSRDITQYFNSYVKAFMDTDNPVPLTIYEATVQASHMVAVSAARQMYNERMDSFMSHGQRIPSSELQRVHEELMQECINKYTSAKKLGDPKDHKQYAQELTKGLMDDYRRYSTRNSLVNRFSSPGVYIFFIFVIIVCQGVKWFTWMLGLSPLTRLASRLRLFSFLGIIIYWAAGKYYPPVQVWIATVIGYLWDISLGGNFMGKFENINVMQLVVSLYLKSQGLLNRQQGSQSGQSNTDQVKHQHSD